MKKKKICALGTAIVLACSLMTGCGSQSSSEMATGKYTMENTATDYATDDVYDSYAEEEFTEEADEGGEANDAASSEENQVAANRKLVKTVDMSVETEEFDTLTKKLEDKVEALGGYMEKAYVSGTSIRSSYDSTRYASYTARIPADKLDEFVTEMSQISNVLDKNETVEDVTLNYVDLESKKSTLEVEQERLMALLEQADSIDTIVALESRLTEIRYQLESMESQLRTYDNLVDYATIYLSVQEVERITPVAPKSSLEKMKDGFVNSVYQIGKGFQNFVIGFVIALPYLVVWGIIILIFILIVKAIIKRKQKKAEKRQKIRQQMPVISGKTEDGKAELPKESRDFGIDKEKEEKNK